MSAALGAAGSGQFRARDPPACRMAGFISQLRPEIAEGMKEPRQIAGSPCQTDEAIGTTGQTGHLRAERVQRVMDSSRFATYARKSVLKP